MAQYRPTIRTLQDHIQIIKDNLLKRMPELDVENTTLKKIIEVVARQSYESEMRFYPEPIEDDEWVELPITKLNESDG